ncbi:MAG: FHA domain-containing protein [Anaerolineae bacterium]|nr:FHA domain-containing protein [Anaerolineae bacterium]MDH7472636.1 FHA domain-containing protein [Anaerolineae bacterium]
MSLDVAIFLLRLTLAAILYAFLGVVFIVIWRDLRAVSRRAEETTGEHLGCLMVVAAGETPLLPGQRLPLAPLTSLGRAVTNTVVIPDAFASAQHALLTWRAGRWWLEDLGSKNGTLLNDEPIPANGPVVVGPGDVIGIGQVRLKLEVD